MLIYNVTINVTWAIHENWLQWMKEKHIPEAMSKNCFTGYRFARILDIDESDGPTYTVQYTADTREQYEQYINLHAPALRKDITDNWGTDLVAFRTLMEVVH
jgi:hypothetical protein